jgi:hypothetical protein
MGNMHVLPIMANTNSSWRFSPNMQHSHMKTMPFVIEMIFLLFFFKRFFNKFLVLLFLVLKFYYLFFCSKWFFFHFSSYFYFLIQKIQNYFFQFLFIIKYACFMPKFWVLCETCVTYNKILLRSSISSWPSNSCEELRWKK